MYFIRNSEDISLDLYNEIKSWVDDSISCWPMYNIDKSISNTSSCQLSFKTEFDVVFLSWRVWNPVTFERALAVFI